MEFAEIKTLKNMLDYAAEHYANNDFMLYKENGAIVNKTYSDFQAAADAFSRMLDENGLKRAHVAVIGPTCFEWVVTYFGTVAADSVIIPLTANETEDMNCKLCDFGDADILVFSKRHEGLFRMMRERVPRVKLYISMDDEVCEEDVISFSSVLEKYAGVYTGEPTSDRFCTLLFTSGTTGFPKGVMLNQHNLVHSAMSVWEYDDAPRVFCCLPISHAYCFTTNITKIVFRGATVCVNDNMNNLLADIRLFRPQSIVCVPLIANKLMSGALRYAKSKSDMPESEAVKEYLGGCGKIISGGAPLEAAYNERYTQAGMIVLNGYGMTECSPVIANNTVHFRRNGSVGRTIPCMRVKIENGEILAHGDGVMLGYYKNEQATKEVLTDDGWLHTGDLGYIDEDGFLFVTGRCKNLILLDNGENVSAEFLEECFANEAIVQEVVAFGENGMICVEIFPNADYVRDNNVSDLNAAMRDLIARINSNLAPHQRITSFYVRGTPFERTASSKIKRTGGRPNVNKQTKPPETEAEIKVCAAVCDVLNRESAGVDENFFALGGDSLTATELAVTLHIGTQMIYDHPVLEDLAKVLNRSEDQNSQAQVGINAVIAKTAGTGDMVAGYKNILLTGSTGFLGIHVLRELLKKDVTVYCLVRNKERLMSQILHYFGALDIDRVVIVLGDIEHENLGLDKTEYDSLCDKIDAVFHIAANVHHAGDYAELKKTNVDGTVNCIEFAKAANAVLHHTSTVSVHGSATVPQSNKTAVFDEFSLDIGQYFSENVYIHSKYRAEEAVLTARLDGLRSNIYRIGNLTWRTDDGVFQINTEDNGFLHRVHAMLKMGMLSNASDKYPIDLTAVDECAEAFVGLAFSGRVNEIYHLMNPNYLSTENLFRYLEIPYRTVSPLELIETVFANTDDRDIRVYMFYMMISGRSAYIDTSCAFTQQRMASVGITWSMPDRHYLLVGNNCLSYNAFDVKPMRCSGGQLNPIQKLFVSTLRKANLLEPYIIDTENALLELSARMKENGIQKPLIITFPIAMQLDSVRTFVESFRDYVIFTDIDTEPTLQNVDCALNAYVKNDCDAVVAIGGGSVLDCAKVCALRAANEGKETDAVCGLFADSAPCAPFFAVPTTAGTGSEMTLFAVLTDSEQQKKVPYLSDRFIPEIIALDASLTVGLPCSMTAATGIDALSHAVEAYISLFADYFPEDKNIAKEACKMVFDNLSRNCNDLQNLSLRKNMLLAATQAGKAFRCISTGYVHAVAHRLGELYHIPHGISIAACFTSVLRAYLPYAEKQLAELSVFCGFSQQSDIQSDAAEAFIRKIDELIDELQLLNNVDFDVADAEMIVLRAQDEVKSLGYPRPFSDAELKNIVIDILE